MSKHLIIETYGRCFKIHKSHLRKSIKNLGYESIKQFLNEYTWDGSLQVYYELKGKDKIISETPCNNCEDYI